MKIKYSQPFKFLISFIAIFIMLILLQFSNVTQHIHTSTIFTKINATLEFQKHIVQKLQLELDEGNYTIDNPFVVLDPYNKFPLTALVMFKTVQPSKIAITLVDSIYYEDKDITSSHKFSEISTKHVIPIYGLFPNTKNTVIIEQFSEKDILIKKNTIEIQTESLPTHLEDLIILTESYSNNYSNGLNYQLNDRYAFDKNGTIRWFFSNSYSSDATYFNYSNNRFFLLSYNEEGIGSTIYEIDKLGKIYSVYYSPFTVHHDIAQLPNGNLLMLNNNGQTVMDFAIELDASTGKVINTMDFKQILQRTRFLLGSPDWLHANSITYDESDQTVIISSNNQSTIAKIKWPEGDIKWLLSSPEEYLPRLQKYLLKPIDEDFEYSYNQHDVNILPDYDNNPDTIDISVFDNGLSRPYIDKDDKYSRLVHYRINEKNMTVEQIWQYGKEQPSNLYALNRSSFKILPNENRLGLFCITIKEEIGTDRLVEVDKA